MKKPFMQVASDGVYEILVEGVIRGEEFFGDEFTPDMVREELAIANGKPIRIAINSPGGDCFAGAAIFNALEQYEGRKIVRVDGVAASMASIIAMVGDEIYMSPGSTMMVHKPSAGAYGNTDDLKRTISMLDALEETMIDVYKRRTGLSEDKIAGLLEEEKWMSPAEAVELGFADKFDKESQPSSSLFDKVKTILKDEQFAFSMSAVHKSLEDYVAKAEAPSVEDVPKEEEEVQDDTLATPSTDEVVEQPNEVETPNEEEVEQPGNGEQDEPSVEETPEAPEVTEPAAAEIKKPVAKVTMNKEIAADAVAPQALADPAVATAKVENGITRNEYKVKFVEMLSTAYSGDKNAAKTKADELKATMVINGTSGEPLYGSEVLATDIRQAYTNVGRVGALVNRIDIEGAETFKQLVETAGNGFTPVALGGTKTEDQPVWTPVVFEPHEFALIVAWLDGVQKRSPIAIYNQIVRYIAREYAKLEDTIILTWGGGTFGGETFPQTGLVPTLVDEGRVTPVASYDSEAILPAIGLAYGSLETDQTIALVTNRATWGALATAIDGDGRAAFTVVGEQVAAGALGSFRVVLSEVLEDGDVVVGAFDDYNLVTRGGLSTLFSREATVGSLNLFTQDASALRADVDITGGPVAIESFQLLQFATS